ncbi:MAG TPA: hypothetical protein VF196_04720, partial [Casimicrobiaceae bacterium]
MQIVDAEAGERAVAAMLLLVSADVDTFGNGDLDRLAGAVQRVRGISTVAEIAIARRREVINTAPAMP